MIKGAPVNPLSLVVQVCKDARAAETSLEVASIAKAISSIKAVVSSDGWLATHPIIKAAAKMRRRPSGLFEGTIPLAEMFSGSVALSLIHI